MRVQLIANLAANGELVLAAQADAYQAPPEIAGMGFAHAAACGNIVMGATTYGMFAPIMKDALAQLDVVVLGSGDIEGASFVADSAQSAIAYLEERGYETACVAGGTMTYNAFLAEGLADDLFFNIFPVVIGGGGCLETAPDKTIGYKLAEVRSAGDVAMLHYTKE